MAMFVGEYTHTVDEKGRITIPARFRPDFEAGLFVTVGLDQCLWVFSRDGWDRFSERLASLPVSQQRTRQAMRFFFSQATDAIPDRQGRVLLPENLRNFANLEDGATIIGVGDKVEIWQPERWAAAKAEQFESLPDIADELSNFGI
ncbi:MAG: division/cell wall cluster transcriptional repressor MraZ [Chloroflexota bacterium]|nr:division/cell wall cluster transcriptional repressor MraZ [Chloroflexota bacterium]